MMAYETLSYVECPDETFEPGYEKIAIFVLNGVPTHAARQLDSKYWTSKLGKHEDISHSLHDLAGHRYGLVERYMKRPKKGKS